MAVSLGASHRCTCSAAANIASVPCRCGHSCTYGPAPRPVIGRAGVEQRPGVDRGDGLAAQRVGHHADGLRQVRRTRRVQHDAAVAGQRDGRRPAVRVCSFASAGTSPGWRRQRASGRAPQRAESRARRVDEHPVERAGGQAGLATVDPQHLDVQAARRSARRARRGAASVRRPSRAHPTAAAMAASNAVLPPGPAAQVEPAAVGRRRRAPASAPGPPAGCPRPAPAPIPSRTGVELTGVTARQVHRVRRVAPDLAVDRLRQLLRRQHAGPGGQVHQRPRRRRWRAARPARPASAPSASANACAIHRGWAWVKAMWPTGSVSAGGASSATQDASSRAEIVRSTPLTKPARAVSNSMAACSTVVSTAACGVDAGAQQLVGAEPQQVEQHRVDAVDRPVRRVHDDGVEQAEAAARAVGEFGGEGGVTPGDLTFAQQCGQDQVGVGVAFGDRAQHVEGRLARGVERLASVAAVPSCGRRHWARRVLVEAGTAGPVGGLHRLLAGRLDLAEQHRVRRRADVDAVAIDANLRRAATALRRSG